MPEAPFLGAPLPWNLVANAYASSAINLFEAFAKRVLAAAPVSPSDRVLDVAAGPGTFALLAAREGAKVNAIDFSPSMIAELRARAEPLGLRVDVREADAQALPFEDASFDAVYMLFGIMFLPDRAAGFRELHRVLAAGGRAAVTTWVPMSRFPALAEPLGILAEHVPGMPVDELLPLGDASELAQEMRDAGFDDVTTTELPHPFEIPNVEALWAGLQQTNAAVVLARHRVGEDGWPEIANTVAARLRARHTGPVRGSFVANLALATKRPAR